MRIRIAFGRLLSVLLALAAVAVSVVATGGAAAGGHGKKPQKVNSRDDGAKEKLAPELQAKLEGGSTAPVAVVATIQNGDLAQATALLTDSRTASKNGVALVVGNVAASKLAGVKGVVSVSAVEFRQTGQPVGNDPDVGNPPDKKTRTRRSANSRRSRRGDRQDRVHDPDRLLQERRLVLDHDDAAGHVRLVHGDHDGPGGRAVRDVLAGPRASSVSDSSGHFSVIFKSSVALSGLSADAFGLSQPKTLSEQVKQDDPDDPSSASVKENVTIDHASRATFTLGVDSDDVDVFVVYDANNDGTFASDEIVGSSTGPAGTDEELTLPEPVAGDVSGRR